MPSVMRVMAIRVYVSQVHTFRGGRRPSTDRLQYACLVPTCDRLCSTAPKRRMHCVDKHQFPKNYDFFIINDGIDRRNSMLRPTHRRRSSTMNSATSNAGRSTMSAAGDGMDVVPTEREDQALKQQRDTRSPHIKLRGRGGFSHPQGYRLGGENQDQAAQSGGDVVDSLTTSMSALHFVPHSVRMARGRGRGRGA